MVHLSPFAYLCFKMNISDGMHPNTDAHYSKDEIGVKWTNHFGFEVGFNIN